MKCRQPAVLVNRRWPYPHVVAGVAVAEELVLQHRGVERRGGVDVVVVVARAVAQAADAA